MEQILEEGPALMAVSAGKADAPQGQELETARDGQADVPRGRFEPQGLPTQDLDEPRAAGHDEAPDANIGARHALWWLASAVVLLAVIIVVTFLISGGGPAAVPAAPHHPPATPVVSAVPIGSNQAASRHDQAIAYSPTTDSCPGGPTSPLALTDTAADSAWVCSRGPQESRLDGQILHITFACDRARADSACGYMLSALSVTPGWVAKTPGGKEEWLQHRVVTRLQFNFYTGERLAADPFFLDTNGAHGPVPATLPGKILASRVEVIVLHTQRPPTAPVTGGGLARAGTAPPGLIDSLTGSGDPAEAPPTDAGLPDAVDATFAMSQLQFFGHPPN